MFEHGEGDTAEVPSVEDDRSANDRPRPRSLILLSSAGRACVELATGQEVLIGREAPSTTRIDDPSLSRRHARIWVDHDGAWIEDLGSTNGTWINSVRVIKGLFGDGDEVHLGSVRAFIVDPLKIPPAAVADTAVPEPKTAERETFDPMERLARYESAQIRRALEDEGWNLIRSAQRVGIPVRMFVKKVKALGLKRPPR
ncbi:MAG: FHA domain-containing protein [Deltaproteobacteria bacterium]|nr:FHA domain-containing protein [Deltaproteobacteria bacterium]